MKAPSEFIKNIITLLSGTTIAQAIPIIITPIIARLYTPEDFGVLAIFMAINLVLGTVASGRYELAIMDPETDDEAVSVAALAILVSFIFSIILFVPIFIFNSEIISLFKSDDLTYYLYFCPVVVWVVALYNIINQLNIRKKEYRDIAVASIYKSTVLSVLIIFVGYIKDGALGLILGQVISYFVSNARLLSNIMKNYNVKNFTGVRKVALKYIEFPKYSVVASLANTSSVHVVNMLISSFYSISTLGLYSLTERVLGAPLALISKAVGQVYFEKSTKELREEGGVEKTFYLTLKILFLVGLPIFTAIYYLVPAVFLIVFGEQWKEAGEYAQILAPLFFIRFIVSPLTLTNVVFRRNKQGMWWQIILLTLHVLILMYADYSSLGIKDYLSLVTYIIGAHYLVLLILMSRYKVK